MSEEPNYELRDSLFPDGKPEPEDFIAAIAELAKQLRAEKDGKQ